MTISSPIRNSALLLALIAALAVIGAAEPSDAGGKSYLQVSAREYYYGLSRTTVRPGKVSIELVNYGEDDHDLALRRRGGGPTIRMSTVKPGERGHITATLKSGRYSLWCTIGDHKSRGMKASLRVKR